MGAGGEVTRQGGRLLVHGGRSRFAGGRSRFAGGRSYKVADHLCRDAWLDFGAAFNCSLYRSEVAAGINFAADRDNLKNLFFDGKVLELPLSQVTSALLPPAFSVTLQQVLLISLKYHSLPTIFTQKGIINYWGVVGY